MLDNPCKPDGSPAAVMSKTMRHSTSGMRRIRVQVPRLINDDVFTALCWRLWSDRVYGDEALLPLRTIPRIQQEVSCHNVRLVNGTEQLPRELAQSCTGALQQQHMGQEPPATPDAQEKGPSACTTALVGSPALAAANSGASEVQVLPPHPTPLHPVYRRRTHHLPGGGGANHSARKEERMGGELRLMNRKSKQYKKASFTDLSGAHSPVACYFETLGRSFSSALSAAACMCEQHAM